MNESWAAAYERVLRAKRALADGVGDEDDIDRAYDDLNRLERLERLEGEG